MAKGTIVDLTKPRNVDAAASQRIQRRLQEIAEQREILDHEEAELVSANNVLQRLMSGAAPVATKPSTSRPEATRRPQAGAAKQTYSIPQAAEFLLRKYGPLGSADMHARIVQDSSFGMSDLIVQTLTSTLSRMKRQNRVVLDGDKWKLPDRT